MKRICTVEFEPGWGWIARNPWTGAEIWPDWRWASRSVARAVVQETYAFPEFYNPAFNNQQSTPEGK